MPSWVEAGYQEYIKRLGPELQVQLKEISPEKRGKSSDIKRIMQKEGRKMLQAIPSNTHVIALDREGQSWSTEKLAERISHWQQEGLDLTILIGGPEGMTKECTDRAHIRLSFSAMTFPHPLVRIILAEQIYRVSSILKNHPYHK